MTFVNSEYKRQIKCENSKIGQLMICLGTQKSKVTPASRAYVTRRNVRETLSREAVEGGTAQVPCSGCIETSPPLWEVIRSFVRITTPFGCICLLLSRSSQTLRCCESLGDLVKMQIWNQ